MIYNQGSGGSGGILPTITVTAPTGSTVTCTKGSTTLTATESSGTWIFKIKEFGTWTVNATLGSESASGTVEVDKVKNYSISLAYTRIYGVQWAGTSSTKWSRTDESSGFSDPVPYVSGSSSYGSPFDSLQPWAGMTRVTDSTVGELVKIPKFWFKWTGGGSGNTLKLQIADGPVEGFSVSPAHMDRGDGKGVRDYVYVGRYHCSTSDYKSTTGVKPKASITRSAARSAIAALGSDIWQIDYATRLTIQMLYLVEFGDWNSQTTIGYGCGNNSATQNMGYTDSMPYHTGTTQSSRTTYGLGTQYRYIEGLWDNVYDWLDGCYYNSSGMNVILNPSNFSDSSGGTSIGTPSSEYPTVMSLSSTSGYSWALYPTTAGGSNTTYVSDVWGFSSSYPCLFVGGVYFQSLDYGMFYVSYNSASYASGGIGARLLKLP